MLGCVDVVCVDGQIVLVSGFPSKQPLAAMKILRDVVVDVPECAAYDAST